MLKINNDIISLALYRFVIGYDQGTIMVKIGLKFPVTSMNQSGEIVWAKDDAINTFKINSVEMVRYYCCLYVLYVLGGGL